MTYPYPFFLFVVGCGEERKSGKQEPSFSTSPISSKGKMKMDMGDLEVGGGCTSKIEKTLQKKTEENKGCYQRLLKSNPSLKGTLRLGFWIQENGSVDEIQISNSTQSNQLSHCIKKRVTKWDFPTNCSTPLKLSFVFTP